MTTMLKADVAVFRPSERHLVHTAKHGWLIAIPWGQNGDIAASGDYDGDGDRDLAVFRNGAWYINGATVLPPTPRRLHCALGYNG